MHTYIRLRGFGYGIVPHAPYVVQRIGDGLDDCIHVETDAGAADVDPRVRPLGQELRGIADVHETPGPDRWVIDFGHWTVTWPNHFSLRTADSDDTPFVLHGGDNLIWVQGPFAPTPADSDFVAPGQRVVAHGDELGFHWLELHYEHDGAAMLQRHHILSQGLVVTLQEPQAATESAGQIAAALAEQLLSQSMS